MSSFIKTVLTWFVLIHIGFLLGFIAVNWAIECQSWTDGSCVTPAEYYTMWFKVRL
jgi:hypothetical protein